MSHIQHQIRTISDEVTFRVEFSSASTRTCNMGFPDQASVKIFPQSNAHPRTPQHGLSDSINAHDA
jgi:hypothetical protein